ncbi:MULTISPECIES: aldehyde dehydrogenase family protein [unclassified Rhodococcus (in: high G+C Gram-positive bacteria)]|uniref:aldehyde dehydrogenase family protein n=1 Tax=unclassified Rhodococcus (in: high G+C Gram-positive bacteria) TaxID=192944 RepID=UPI0007015454|nr:MULTISPECIES: aldehyde dehydrogenase family protein [unclassified Rhodococcus (in: high G+C Gram-positive bacteria)]KQU28465.1 betaine-aldehyde dehydrogenase [Rhodococcus sp. Leaf225]KQU47654.1 betaine-aldehyde dehydrogenase [Rhodococcus sp. Leaf258]
MDPARAFLARDVHHPFVDGRRVPADSGDVLSTVNPSTGEVFAHIGAGGESDIDRAVVAARRAFQGEWSSWTPYDRQALLTRVAHAMDENFDELVQIEALDMGAPVTRLRNSKSAMMKMLAFFSTQAGAISGDTLMNGIPGDIATMTLKAPVGVIGGIIPWNGPLGGQFWIVGAVLASGCTTVLKPSEDASLSVLRTAEILHEVGVPAGVVNVVTGLGKSAGHALASHPDVDRIAFTGSTETGRSIIKASTVNIKGLQLELGGKSADIVCADADLDKAVPGAAMGVFANSGQICFAGTRVLVQRPIVDEFTDRLLKYMDEIRVGHSLDDASTLGPVISEPQLEKVLAYTDIGRQEGAELLRGGERLGGDFSNGYFMQPTVFGGVSNDMRIAREEIFGPVLSILPFDDVDEAIHIANDSDYGLGGAVWSRGLSTAMKVVRGVHTGTMWVNCYGYIDPMVGFGGTKLSGYGAKGNAAHMDNYLYSKCVYMEL